MLTFFFLQEAANNEDEFKQYFSEENEVFNSQNFTYVFDGFDAAIAFNSQKFSLLDDLTPDSKHFKVIKLKEEATNTIFSVASAHLKGCNP